MTALARSAIAENGVSVQTRLTDGLAPVEGDRVQLQQVILNLALNAVEALSAVDEGERELLISTEQRRTGGVLVAVRVSGPGIDPEHIERVFEASYTTKSSGVGMGCRSAARSSKPTAAGCGLTQTSPEARYSSSPCPVRKGAHEFSAGGSPESRATLLILSVKQSVRSLNFLCRASTYGRFLAASARASWCRSSARLGRYPVCWVSIARSRRRSRGTMASSTDWGRVDMRRHLLEALQRSL